MSSKDAFIIGHSCNSTNAGASSVREPGQSPTVTHAPESQHGAHGQPDFHPWHRGLYSPSHLYCSEPTPAPRVTWSLFQ